ncbi:DegT/DnrJ/EryC1/StrS family aminotransferase [Roseobacter sp. HKCCA2468]|uniref:DegT/DnrJ/EryC1/StrS family aminotransferase n=1 Tax=Roseobacter sp. HKCCA2468 TaxID=3120342 RepID=UPI0030EB91BD
MIPVNRPKIWGSEIDIIKEAIDDGWISSESPYSKRLETEFAKACDRKYGVAVSNGTVALELALKVLNISEGDEVIIPSHMIVSLLNSILRVGATPVFIDSSLHDWNLDIDLLPEKITERTKAIIAPHTYGLAADMVRLSKIAKENNVYLIEDFAQAIGNKFDSGMAGSFGDVSCCSLYANKNITSGEGGFCLTDDESIAEKIRWYSNLCFEPNERFKHFEIGSNYRLSGLQSAFALGQLRHIDEANDMRISNGNYYRERIDPEKFTLPSVKNSMGKNHYWVFGLLVKGRHTAAQLSSYLLEHGIQTRPFFFPLEQQPLLKRNHPHCRISSYLREKGLYIPSGLGNTLDEFDFVIEKLNKYE